MGFTNYLPFTQSPNTKVAKPIDPVDDGGSQLAKKMKRASLALGFGSSSIFTSRATFEEPPFDLEVITQAVDTDSYVKRAFLKWRELTWKEGWDIVGENPEAVDYLYQRLDFMELAMGQPIQQFFEDVADQCVKYANCYIRKARGDLAPYFPGKISGIKKNGEDEKLPIIGFEILPTEYIRIRRDKNNNTKKYMQVTNGTSFGSGFMSDQNTNGQPQWSPDDIIHMHRDRKPGHIFGTPFLTAALEDITALRQIEEDLLNLIHQELFPLYSVTVGTDEHPGEDDEIIQAADEIANMKTEGALVHSERRKIEVLGGQGEALQIDPYLIHFKERIAVGLGIFPHHLGMAAQGANRSMTDRLDVALYDEVKNFQRYVADAIRVFIFNELLIEGGFNPFENPRNKGASDRCFFSFKEIDTDTQIKKETHVSQLWNGNLITLQEARMKLNLDPDVDESELFAAMSARMNPTIVPSDGPASGGSTSAPASKSSGSPAVSKAKPNPKVLQVPAAAQKVKPSTGGKPNRPNGAQRGTSNKMMPANQHGRKMSPNVRHSEENDVSFIDEEIIELLDKDEFNEF